MVAEILEYGSGGIEKVRFHYDGIFMERLEELGKMPLHRILKGKFRRQKEMYQTVYSKVDGSVAAPTAVFILQEELLEKVKKKRNKISLCYFLHVGNRNLQTGEM